MNISYSKTRLISTAEMPGVYLDPPLTVEYLRQPSLGFTRKLMVWETKGYDDDALLLDMAAELIISVTNDEGERYEMASPENIQELAEATELGIELVWFLLRGWTTVVGTERLAHKKKLSQLSTPSAFTKANKTLAA